MHAAQQEVPLWRHSQMFLAASAQRSLRNPYRLADLGDVERFSRILLDQLVEAAHHDRVLALRQTVLATLAGAEASDLGLGQALLQASPPSGIGDYFQDPFSQISGSRVQSLKSRHCGWWRDDQNRVAWRRQIHLAKASPIAAISATGSDMVPYAA